MLALAPRKLGAPYFGVLIIRILQFKGPLFSETPQWLLAHAHTPAPERHETRQLQATKRLVLRMPCRYEARF